MKSIVSAFSGGCKLQAISSVPEVGGLAQRLFFHAILKIAGCGLPRCRVTLDLGVAFQL